MTLVAFICGLFCGLILGSAHNTYNWPTSVMVVKESQAFSLVVSSVVSGAAGMVLGVSVTSGGVNTLVGTAISAGLLPPIVNAGMLVSYGYSYAPLEQRVVLNEMAVYALSYYASHVVVIFLVANFMFYLKEINPKFKSSEDDDYDDIPTLVEYKKKQELERNMTTTEKLKTNFIVENLRQEFESFAENNTIDKIGDKIREGLAPLNPFNGTMFDLNRNSSMHGNRQQSTHGPPTPLGNNHVPFNQVGSFEETKRGMEGDDEIEVVFNPMTEVVLV